jgi:hypothetical protein
MRRQLLDLMLNWMASSRSLVLRIGLPNVQ